FRARSENRRNDIRTDNTLHGGTCSGLHTPGTYDILKFYLIVLLASFSWSTEYRELPVYSIDRQIWERNCKFLDKSSGHGTKGSPQRDMELWLKAVRSAIGG